MSCIDPLEISDSLNKQETKENSNKARKVKKKETNCCTRRCGVTVPFDDVKKFIQSYKNAADKCAFYDTYAITWNRGRRQYYIRGEVKEYRVCSVFFAKTLGSRPKARIPVGSEEKWLSRQAYDEIVRHIKSFPQFPCKTSSNQFFRPGMKLEKMYSRFKSTWLKDSSLPRIPPRMSAYK